MKTYRHGLTIGIERVEDNFYLTIKAIGTLSHEDYEKITPMLESALEGINKPKIKAFIDCSELDGWDLQAAWDDFKLGLKHGNEFEKIAILKGKNWIKFSSKIIAWFIQGEIKNFENENEAFKWLEE